VRSRRQLGEVQAIAEGQKSVCRGENLKEQTVEKRHESFTLQSDLSPLTSSSRLTYRGSGSGMAASAYPINGHGGAFSLSSCGSTLSRVSAAGVVVIENTCDRLGMIPSPGCQLDQRLDVGSGLTLVGRTTVAPTGRSTSRMGHIAAIESDAGRRPPLGLLRQIIAGRVAACAPSF